MYFIIYVTTGLGAGIVTGLAGLSSGGNNTAACRRLWVGQL